MLTIPGVDPMVLWGGFILLIIALLALDLGVFHRKTGEVSIKQALGWAFFWFILAMLFNLWVYAEFGQTHALQFFTGYLIELSLSVDNLFVFLVIFTAFSIPGKYQHRVLFWGIIGAILLRGLFIGLGITLVEHFAWAFVAFGILLFFAAYRMQFGSESKFDPHTSKIVRMIRKFVPVADKAEDGKFITKEHGKRAITVLLLALLVIELSDILFAFDSVPAIFAITTEPYLVFTSNLFAILGLRSLYFVLADMEGMFQYLKTGLSVILLFIAVKLVLKPFHVEIPIILSLIFIGAVLVSSIIMSLLFHRKAPMLGTPQPTAAHQQAIPASNLIVAAGPLETVTVEEPNKTPVKENSTQRSSHRITKTRSRKSTTKKRTQSKPKSRKSTTKKKKR